MLAESHVFIMIIHPNSIDDSSEPATGAPVESFSFKRKIEAIRRLLFKCCRRIAAIPVASPVSALSYRG
jgi:hypothetical protein